MTSGAVHAWIRTSDGELVRSDVIIGLRCDSGEVAAIRTDGRVVRLAGPSCPNDYHLHLLRELGRLHVLHDERWIVIISPDITSDGARWIVERVDELLGSDSSSAHG